MNLEQLRQLETIHQEGTISGAADLLHLSQPALSRSMQRLEREYGQEFFTRQGRRLEFTEAGLVALEYAQRILREERLLREELAALTRPAQALRVGTVAPAPLWQLTSLLLEYFPGTVLTSETLSEREITSRLLDRSLDLGIGAHPVMLPTVRYHKLMVENLSVVLPAGHPLEERSSVAAADFAEGETFLLFAGIGFWWDYVEKCFSHCKFLVEKDRRVFEHLVENPTLPFFVSDAPGMDRPTHQAAIPLEDAGAHATFFLLRRAGQHSQHSDMPQQIFEAFGF